MTRLSRTVPDILLTEIQECILVSNGDKCQIFIDGNHHIDFIHYKEMKNYVAGITAQGIFKRIHIDKCNFKSVTYQAFK